MQGFHALRDYITCVENPRYIVRGQYTFGLKTGAKTEDQLYPVATGVYADRFVITTTSLIALKVKHNNSYLSIAYYL